MDTHQIKKLYESLYFYCWAVRLAIAEGNDQLIRELYYNRTEPLKTQLNDAVYGWLSPRDWRNGSPDVASEGWELCGIRSRAQRDMLAVQEDFRLYLLSSQTTALSTALSKETNSVKAVA